MFFRTVCNNNLSLLCKINNQITKNNNNFFFPHLIILISLSLFASEFVHTVLLFTALPYHPGASTLHLQGDGSDH